MCTFNSADNSYYCKCVDSQYNNDFTQACNYQINYRDFFENETSTTITSSTTTIAASMQIDQQERNLQFDTKGNLKLFSTTFNTENVSIIYLCCS